MNSKVLLKTAIILLVLASGFYLFFEQRGSEEVTVQSGGTDGVDPSGAGEPGEIGGPDRTVVFYFHGDKRCPTCMKLERYTRETVSGRFAGEIAEGAVEFRAVNVDEAGNGHFVTEYGLTSKSVVLVEVAGGRRGRWRDLDRIWDLVGDETAFRRYIEEETARFIGGGDA